MSIRLMVLPAKQPEAIQLVKIPQDMEEHEAYRHATGVISGVEEQNPDYSWEDIEEALEEHGFQKMDFVLGPAVD